MYMTVSLALLGLLSLGLVILWRKRLVLTEDLFVIFKSKFGFDKIDISDELVYTQCISSEWVFRNVVCNRGSRIGRALRNLINNRTLLGTVLLFLALGPVMAAAVYTLYSSFVFVGASLAVVIAAVFLIFAPGSVTTSYSFLTWLKDQDESDLKKNDLAYATVSLRSVTDWIKILTFMALASLMVAPWGEILPELTAMGVSMFFGIVYAMFYQALSTISPGVAFIGSIFIIVLLVVLVVHFLAVIARRSISGLKKLAKMQDND
ncbi:MAG: hypothetical protein ACFFD9_09660 [Candidatus Thorarchaeota archaeon]